MGLRLLQSANGSTGNLMLTLPRGKYRRLIIHVNGTNASGVTFLPTDVYFTLERGGNKVSMNMQDLMNNNNFDGGFPTATSTANSTLNLFASYDCFLSGDKNNVFLAGIDDSRVQITWQNTAKISTGSVSVYAEYGQGTESYIVRWKNFSTTLPGSAGSQVTQNLSDQNITRLYFRTASDIGHLSVKRDDVEVVASNGTALAALAAYDGKAEAAVSFIVADLSGSRTPADVVSNSLSFTITQATGSTATEMPAYMQTIEINSAKMQESATQLSLNNAIAGQTYPPIRQVQIIHGTIVGQQNNSGGTQNDL